MNRSARLSDVGRAPTEAQWQAISERRAATPAAAPWFLVVTSTGIVCRPGCPARVPLRRNVRIVSSVAEAVAAGARPCLRCRPEGARVPTILLDDRAHGASGDSAPHDLAASVLRRLEQALLDGVSPPTDVELATEHGVSERRLRTLVRGATGVTPRSWVAARRAERLRAGLAARRPVLDAVFEAGYESPSAAYEAAASIVGMPPARYQAGGSGEMIRWTATPTQVGMALVAATDRGLCAVKVGDDVDALESDLRREFPRAAIERDDTALAGAAALVADLAAGHRRQDVTSIPLDLAGTAFRRRVWEALRAIPRGETRTYQGVAASLGMPKAARAVGSACASNPVAVVVPCHRVIGSDGELHGYRWGLDRKRRILEAERTREAAAAAGRSGGTDGEPSASSNRAVVAPSGETGREPALAVG